MRKALPITVILLLLTLSMTQFATAQQAQKNIITNQTTETLYVISSTKYGAEGAIPTGYRTSGWKTIAAGEEKTFWAYDPHKIYFQIFKGSEPIKPQRTTETFAFWIHRNANFNIVTQQAINADIIRGQLVYSSHNTGDLIHSDGFIVYNNGARITVTDAWVPVSQRAVPNPPPNVVELPEVVDPNAPVDIPDLSLRTAIEIALVKNTGDTITRADMLTLTALDISEIYTEDLTGLEFGLNLRQLNLSRNWIEDISPLAGLRNLASLDLSENAISDISLLAGLTRLTSLNLENVPIEDVSPLAGLKTLTSLNLTNIPIEDISFLAGLTNLTTLNISFSGPWDISPLANLRNLTSLNLSHNWIEDVSLLAGLTRLTSLNLENVPIEDVSLLADLTRLTSLNLAGVPISIEDVSFLAGLTNLTSLDLSLNAISDVSPLANLRNLTALDLSENFIEDISPLADLANLTALDLSLNAISDISPLTNLRNLTSLNLYQNLIEDISPLADLTNLTALELSENNISDVSPLASLTNLRALYLFHNHISDFSPIAALIPNLETYHSGRQSLSAVVVAPEAPVAIPDPVLRAAIEKELGKPPGARITQAEMATLTAFSFDSSEASIQDLTGLEFAVNLTELHVKSNQIADISALAGLKNLTWLDLSYNLILDVSAVAGLNNLIWLDLSANPYTYRIGSERINIVPIAQLQNLRHLGLARNRISNVAPIAQLKNLSSLDLSHNAISDISPIAALKGLETLKLFDNTISNVSALADLKNLTTLNLFGNAIWDVLPLTGLTNLIALNLSDNAISDISPLTRLEYLKTLYLNGNQISDFSPIAALIPNLETYENNNQARLTTVVDPGVLVNIPDPNLRTAIEIELRKSAGARITQAEMAKLSRLSADSSRIQDLTGLEFAINLRALRLSGNEISDISALAALKNLTVLYLSNNQISDVTPLTDLENLTDLYLSYNWIADFSPIAALIPNLETYKNNDQDPLAVATDPEASVAIPDPVLRAAIERELGKPPGTTITQAEMATLIAFDSLESAGIHDIAGPGIQDLTGLEFAINLQTLELDWVLHIPTNSYRENRSISDVSPLANLHNLTALDLANNQISDVSPLVNLANLTRLDLGYNDIPDTTALFSLLSTSKNLTWLRLSRLRNITPRLLSALSDLENLATLDLSINQISDISPLADLENLVSLNLSNNWIADVSPLADLENLVSLNLSNNWIADVSSLAALKNLTRLDLDLSINRISDVSPLADLENLATLDLSDNRISDISSLAALKNLWRLYLSNNRISDISSLAALKNLLELRLNENHISDFSPIAALIPNLNRYENSDQVSLTAAVDPEAPVHIRDSALRTAIEKELGKLPGTRITQAEMATLTSLDPFGIRDLTGIEFAINLRALHLWDNRIADLSALRALENLEQLTLAGGQLSDVSLLAALNNLAELSLSENQISDVSALAALNSLTWLSLSNNQISDVSALAALNNLTELSLSENQISDVSALAALNNLTWLSLSNNQISNISRLAHLHNLTELSLSNNQISDISALAHLHNLTELSLSNNQISDISALAHLHNLTNLRLSENQISDASPLAHLHNLTELSLSENQISDASVLTALENLTSVDVALVPFCLTLDPHRPGVPINLEPPGPNNNPLPEGARGAVTFGLTGSQSILWTKADTIYEESLSDGVVLTVKFLNGKSDQHADVERYAPLWEDHGAVRFEFTTTGASDINIHFGSGHDSAKLGIDGVDLARAGQITMRLTTIDKRTILHEFGHALGFIHEHQTPAESDLDLDEILKDARAEYEDEGLSETEIEEKLETNYERLAANSNANNFSEFDPKSIMLYGGLPLKNGGKTKWNDDLSALDKKYMGIFYPKPDPLISSIRVTGISDGESIETGTTRSLEATVHASDGSQIPGKAVAFSFSHAEDGDRFASAVFTHTLAQTDQTGGAARTKVTFGGVNDYVIISVKAAGSELKEDIKIYVTGEPAASLTQEFNFRIDSKSTLFGGKRDWSETITVKPPIDGARVTITKVDVSGKTVDRSRIKWWNLACWCWNYGPWGTSGIYKDETYIFNADRPSRNSYVSINGWVKDGLLEYASVRVTGTIYYEYVATAPSAWADLPQETSLLPNYPNPFNPETWIPYHLATPADVTLTIYAINGQVVRRLDLGYQAAGFYRSRARAAYWDGRNNVGERVASGLYFYTLTTGDFAATRKMLIRK